jgi:hypothetical protein
MDNDDLKSSIRKMYFVITQIDEDYWRDQISTLDQIKIYNRFEIRSICVRSEMGMK